MFDWTSSFALNKGLTRRRFMFAAGASGFLATHPLKMWGQKIVEIDMEDLRDEFVQPPMSSRPWVYWWWLEGVATTDGITADLEEMKKQGISGVLIFDAGRTGSSEPKGPRFMSEEWRANFRHAIREAARLNMEVGVSLCTGWDAGGSWVERSDAIKILVWREMRVTGPRTLTEKEVIRSTDLQSLSGPMKQSNPEDWYREIAVMACPANGTEAWSQITETEVDEMRLWNIPAGDWTILQFGYALSGKQISLTSYGQEGWEIDPMDAHALDNHFRNTAALLVDDAGEHAGKTFKYTHIDSWEIGQPTWSKDFAAEFKKRRGYDLTPFLPALAGKTVESADVTRRFGYDYRRVIADLVQENYYGHLTELSHQHNLGTHSESGGPFYLQYIDALACLGTDDIPMAEFWSTPPRYKIGEGVSDPFFQSTNLMAPESHTGSVRQAASAARIYGKAFCQAESFTGYNQDWSEDPYRLKADGDRAFCLGLGRVVVHHYASVPDFGNPPGNQWEHISIHFNRYVTWWDKSHAWLTYLGRCQHLLRQGDFVADILFYAGEAIPNFVLVDQKPVAGFDFDTTNAQALLTHASVKDGDVTFGTGTAYRYLVIPGTAGQEMSLAVLAKLHDMVHDGMTLIASRPRNVPGLASYHEAEEQLRRTADELWGSTADAKGEKKIGRGRVIWGRTTEEVIAADGLHPDIEIRGTKDATTFDWIHRRQGSLDIYFVANSSEDTIEHEVVFRASGRVPELWNAVTGTVERIRHFREEGGRTVIAMRFAAKESFFIVFSSNAKRTTAREFNGAFPELKHVMALDGPWEVQFDPTWGGPKHVTFDRLQDWTAHSDDGIRHYSGTATYRKVFSLAWPQKGRCYLDLGTVKNVAQVYLNGKDLGVLWTAPWRIEITEHMKQGSNELKIELVNLWPNRLIKDATLPTAQRLTKTNVRTYDPILPKDLATRGNSVDEERRKLGKPPELFPSGLLGPVSIQNEIPMG